MNEPTLFDPGPPDPPPRNDAAPAATGAGVKGRNRHPKSTDRSKPPAQHNAPPGTSKAAARRLAGDSATQQRAEVLAVIVEAGAHGATDAEIEAATSIRAQSVSPRRGELRDRGLIVDSGRRRPTPRGRAAAVWVTPNHAPRAEGEPAR